jgi:hypothetical protein
MAGAHAGGVAQLTLRDGRFGFGQDLGDALLCGGRIRCAGWCLLDDLESECW